MQRTDSLEKTLMQGKIEGGRRGWQRMRWLDGIINSVDMFSSVQSLSHAWLFATWWTAALQASLSITNSQSLLKLMSIKSVMPSNHLILCHPFLFLPSIFSVRWLFTSGGHSIGASASVLPANIQGWFPLVLTGLISLLSKGLSESVLRYVLL